MISIICPIYNEEKFIGKCIESILKQDYDLKKIEVFFIDGMSTDHTRQIVGEFAAKYPFIKVLDNPHKVVPFALNIGVKNSIGDYVIRIDAHCTYPSNYISTLIKYANQLDCDNVGALCRTLPANNTTKCLAISLGMSHKFGVGNSLFRVGVNNVTKVDTVPFGCFKKTIFDKVGLFDEELIRNQDDEFNGRIIKNGGSIYLVPELVIDYFARDSISKTSKMFYQYGLFKPLVNRKLGSPATIRQFFPLVFLIGLVAGFLLSFVHFSFFCIYASVLTLYSILCLLFSIQLTSKYKKTGLLIYMPIIFATLHISYGWGYLKGLFKKNITVNVNR